MKNPFCLLSIFIFFFFAILVVSQVTQTEKTRIAVLDLRAESLSQQEVVALSDRLRTDLFNTGKFKVMERGLMSDIIQEQGFQKSGMCDDENCLIEVGQLLGVEKMVGGSIGKLGTVYLVNLRLIDMTTGQIEKTVSEDCRCPLEELLISINRVARKLADLEVAEKKKTVPKQQAPSPKVSPRPIPQKPIPPRPKTPAILAIKPPRGAIDSKSPKKSIIKDEFSVGINIQPFTAISIVEEMDDREQAFSALGGSSTGGTPDNLSGFIIGYSGRWKNFGFGFHSGYSNFSMKGHYEGGIHSIGTKFSEEIAHHLWTFPLLWDFGVYSPGRISFFGKASLGYTFGNYNFSQTATWDAPLGVGVRNLEFKRNVDFLIGAFTFEGAGGLELKLLKRFGVSFQVAWRGISHQFNNGAPDEEYLTGATQTQLATASQNIQDYFNWDPVYKNEENMVLRRRKFSGRAGEFLEPVHKEKANESQFSDPKLSASGLEITLSINFYRMQDSK